jgi:4-amino-4-deoxy-L-arabinose transferase-like glycosyltransferase
MMLSLKMVVLPSGRVFAGVLFALTLLRVAAVTLSPVELGPDEAQYWGWAQTAQLGYFSKPPLIAWLIAASTSVFGESEAAVRLLSPILHAAAATAVYGLARVMGFREAAGAAGLIYALMPAVTLSSSIASTDAVLMPLWTLSLIALWRFRQSGSIWWALVWGAAAGLAFYAKYAAVYAVIGAAAAIAIDPVLRQRCTRFAAIAGPAALALVLAPHLAWNVVNDFTTVAHLGANANWTATERFNLDALSDFLVEQFAVFGPVAFAALVALAVKRSWITKPDPRLVFLACFIIPPLLIVAGQAFIVRANANWAATAYPAASVLVAAWAARTQSVRVLAANAALNGFVSLLFLALILSPALTDALGLSNAFKRARGWQASADAIAAEARKGAFAAIVVDNRLLFHELSYYGDPGYRSGPARLGGTPVYMWKRFSETVSHAEAVAALPAGAKGPFLLASVTPDYNPWFQADFRVKVSLGQVIVPLGSGKTRAITFYRVADYAPASRALAAPADAVER